LGHTLRGVVPIDQGETVGEGRGRVGVRMLVPKGLEDGGVGGVVHAFGGEMADGLAEGPVAHETIKHLEKWRGG
jgi:hypothetical protein